MNSIKHIALIVAGAGLGRVLVPALVPVWLGWVAVLAGGAAFIYAYFKSE